MRRPFAAAPLPRHCRRSRRAGRAQTLPDPTATLTVAAAELTVVAVPATLTGGQNWGGILSLGEKQRMQIVRLIYHRVRAGPPIAAPPATRRCPSQTPGSVSECGRATQPVGIGEALTA